jgi:hypothetical protein
MRFVVLTSVASLFLVLSLAARPDAVAQSVDPASPDGAAAPAPSGAGATEAMQKTLLADPEIRDKIYSLQEDVLVEDILNDDTTMRAVESGDIDRLLADPKVRALAEHPTVKEIIRDIR